MLTQQKSEVQRIEKREDLEAFIHSAEKMANVESELFYLKKKKIGS